MDGLLDAYLARDGIREITRKADTYHAVHLRRLLGHRKAARRAGITRRITVYGLRHAFATESIRAGGDIRSVAVVMDHSDPSMLLKVYQHILESQMRAAVEAPEGLAA